MRANYVHYSSPQFRILSDKQIEELHFATLQILERTGVAFECQEAIDILGNAGADVSNPDSVKIPSYMVEQALRTAPKMVTLYSREGEPAIVLNRQTGSHFGSMPDCPDFLDPYTRKRRKRYIEDIADTARVIDALPNIEWSYLATPGHKAVPGALYSTIRDALRAKIKPLPRLLSGEKRGGATLSVDGRRYFCMGLTNVI